MGEILGTQMIIENKTGAGGVIAIDAVARAEPDGYTLLNAPLSTAVNETLQKSVRYSLGKEIAAVGLQAETVNVLAGPSAAARMRSPIAQPSSSAVP